jgi:hypothetical protein
MKDTKKRALDRMKNYRRTEDGMKPAMYGRSVEGGGISIRQIIGPKNVYTLSKNRSRSAGDVHGWKVNKQPRKETNL